MLVCNVSMRPPRRAIAADVAEIAAALDASTIGQLVVATLVDDPASVVDTVDAFLGEIMLEAASAADTIDVGLAYAGDIAETTAPGDTPDATVIPAAAASTWNPSDKSASITLSGGDLIATQSSGTSGSGVRSTIGKTSGQKLYFEITSGNSGASNENYGIATASASLNPGGYPGNGAGGLAVFSAGAVWYNGASTGINIGVNASGAKICYAIDLSNNRAWVRVNAGNWNNSGTADPATNTGGIDISSLFASNSAYAIAGFSSGGVSATANFGASAFAQTVPSGFSAWG